MGVEVEIKAWIEDIDLLTARLDELGTFRRRYYKEDRYFGRTPDPKNAQFRLRRDDGRWVCTFKKKQLFDGVEQNQETEFEVSDSDAFMQFTRELGFSVVVEKRKEGASWLVDGVMCEVSSVHSVGDFLELELVLPDGSSESELKRARERLGAVLERIGIPPDRVETRPYTQMIHENISSTGHTAGASL